jgi:hypothetical protein
VICLSFDTDHMSEARMRDWFAGCRFPGAGTFFCTGPYHFLAESGHEVAPHPFLADKSDWEAELLAWRKTFPKANCWRAHSLVFSQYLGVRLGQLGYTITSTQDAFARPDQTPSLSPWGVWQMPIFYMDNADFNRPDFGTLGEYRVFDPAFIDMALESDGIAVFDFHPIHYELNTPDYAFYQRRIQDFRSGGKVQDLSFDGYGVRSFFDDLVAAMARKGLVSLTMSEALAAWRVGNGQGAYRLGRGQNGS